MTPLLRPRLTRAALLALAVSACTQPTTQPPPPPPPIVEAPLPWEPGLTLNDATSTVAFSGWPMVVRLHAVWVSEATEPVALEQAGLTLTVEASGGATVDWPWTRATVLPATTTLGPGVDPVEVAWTLSAAQTAALAPGPYTLRVAWGKAEARQAIALSAPPAPLSPEQRLDLARRAADEATAKGDPRGALTALDQALLEAPGNVGLLTAKAFAHEALGEPRAALAASHLALAGLAIAFPSGPPEPPVVLLKLRQRLQQRLLFGDGGQ